MQALVDGPCSGVARQALGFNKLWLTDFKLKISHSAREKQVRKAYEEANINTKWEQTAWARRIARKARRAQLTDFDRFKLKVLRQRVSIIIRSNLRQGGGTHSLACAVNTSLFFLSSSLSEKQHCEGEIQPVEEGGFKCLIANPIVCPPCKIGYYDVFKQNCCEKLNQGGKHKLREVERREFCNYFSKPLSIVTLI